jgi:asparaginyl-tRNA synthetase
MLANGMLAALKQHEIPAKPYDWYIEIRDTKPALARGWSMCVKRFLAWVLQHNDIRDLTIISRIKRDTFAP